MNFVIYEDSSKFVEKYKEVIFNTMCNYNIAYETVVVNKYDKNILNNVTGSKIYILDIEVPRKNGIDVAREIRNNGDWSSPIIIVTSHEEYKVVGYTAKILMLDFISKDDDLSKLLKDAIEIGLKINGKENVLTISSKSEVVQVPYNDILYIEKNLNDNDSIVVTKNDKYLIRKSIVSIMEELNDDFFKSHRSCIINLNNVKRVNFDENIIYFNDNNSIDLLSRSNKKTLRKLLENKNG